MFKFISIICLIGLTTLAQTNVVNTNAIILNTGGAAAANAYSMRLLAANAALPAFSTVPTNVVTGMGVIESTYDLVKEPIQGVNDEIRSLDINTQLALMNHYPARPFSEAARTREAAKRAFLLFGDSTGIEAFNAKYKLTIQFEE